ncbi:MAG TPA: uridine kinase [Verrucomicrobiae bacterium]|jgi:uridine kinase
MKTGNHPKLIAILGGSGAGKTWLARRLQREFSPQAARLALDDFYRDLSHLAPASRAEVNFDNPQAIDWPAFEKALRDCRNGRVTQIPQYDFVTHTRLPDGKIFSPRPLILVEGLWLLWSPQIAELFDLKIYLDCPQRLRLERRLFRDVAERGRTPDSVRCQFSETVAPMHEQFVAPQAKLADIILKQPPSEMELFEVTEAIRLEMNEARAFRNNAPAHEEFCLQANLI